MLKRKKGRLLLTLLVITGLAGTLNNSTLSQQERKFIVSSFKDSKVEILAGLKEMTEAQLDFRSPSSGLSIRDCFYSLDQMENSLWMRFESAMQEPSLPEKRAEIHFRDDQLLLGPMRAGNKELLPTSFRPVRSSWKSMTAAVDNFKSIRVRHIKYIKSTTEDLRNHLIELQSGRVDCYQFILFISGYSNLYLQQVRQIKAEPAFPISQKDRG